MVLNRSLLDSRRFGIEVFRSVITNEADVAQAIDDRGATLIIARVRAEETAWIERLETGGFFSAGHLVEYRGETSAFVAPTPLEGLSLRDATPDDHDALQIVARRAFRNFTGHYHCDPRLDGAAATEGYVEWCLSALSWTDGFVLLVVDRDHIAGFATVKVDDDEGTIVLNGVDPAYQRRGIYGALVQAIGVRFRDDGVPYIRSSTQHDNVAPQKTWVRAGLQPIASFVTLHRWRDE